MFKSFYDKYMGSTAFLRDGNNDAGSVEKTPAELAAEARKNIKVDVSSRSVEEQENNEPEADKDGEEDNEEDNEDGEESEEKDEEENNENETDEQKTERLAAEKAEKEKAREQRKADRQQRKWDKLAAEKTAAEAEVARLKAQLEEKPKEGLTEEEVERRAAEKAEKALKDKAAKDNEDDFNAKNLKIYEATVKLDKDFDKNIGDLVADIGLIPRPLVYILSELDNQNGHEVMAYLANPDNVDDAEEIWKMNERQMTQRIVRLSDKIKDAKKSTRRPSSVPPPVERVQEHNRRTDVMPKDPTKDMETFVRIRAKQDEERRKARMR